MAIAALLATLGSALDLRTSALAMPDVGASRAATSGTSQDPCVQAWEELLESFDRGDTEQIREQLCRYGSVPHDNTLPVNDEVGDDPYDPRRRSRQEPEAQNAPRISTPGLSRLDTQRICIASSAVAFLGGGIEGTTVHVGADAIVARLCAIWPPLNEGQRSPARRSRVSSSSVLDSGDGRKAYLLTIERPHASPSNETSIFYLSALEGSSYLDLSDRSAVDGDEAVADREANRAERARPASEGSSISLPNFHLRLVHLHVSMAH